MCLVVPLYPAVRRNAPELHKNLRPFGGLHQGRSLDDVRLLWSREADSAIVLELSIKIFLFPSCPSSGKKIVYGRKARTYMAKGLVIGLGGEG